MTAPALAPILPGRTTPKCSDCGAPALYEALSAPGEPFRRPLYLCERGRWATSLPIRRLTAADTVPAS